ncbi:MAG: hypothetical protein J1E58_01605 [Prevotella sp.]|nr:hypothetical protein [Prevotella sp.]
MKRFIKTPTATALLAELLRGIPVRCHGASAPWHHRAKESIKRKDAF